MMSDKEFRDHCAALAMQKIVTVKPVKGGVAVEGNLEAAWDIAAAMVKIRNQRALKETQDPSAKN